MDADLFSLLRLLALEICPLLTPLACPRQPLPLLSEVSKWQQWQHRARQASEWRRRRVDESGGWGNERGFQCFSLLGVASSLLGALGRSLLPGATNREEARVAAGRGLSSAVAPCNCFFPLLSQPGRLHRQVHLGGSCSLVHPAEKKLG